MATLSISGTLKAPLGANLVGAKIQFIAKQTSTTVLLGASAEAVSNASGAYNLTIEHGMYDIYLQPAGQAHQRTLLARSVLINDQITATTLNQLILEVQGEDSAISLITEFRSIRQAIAEDRTAIEQMKAEIEDILNGLEPGPDPAPTYTPPTLTEVSKTDTTISVSWTNPDDLNLFELRLNGADAGTSSITTAEFTTLTADTDYLIEVRAGDGEGNWSAWGSLTVRTEAEAPVEPTTITMSIAEFESGIVGPVDTDRDASRVYLMAGGRSAWVGYIDGTEAYAYVGGSASDPNRVLVSINGGAEFLPEVVGVNKYKLFEGIQASRQVKIRIGDAYGNNSGFPKVGPCLEVTGVNPSVDIPNWLNALDDTNWVTSAVVGSVAGFERQPVLATVENGSSVPSIRFSGDSISEIEVFTHAPTVWYSVDGDTTGWIDAGSTQASDKVVSITGLPAGAHDYNIWINNQTRPHGTGFAVAPDQPIVALNAIGRMDQYGDSITQSTGDLGRVDTMQVAAKLGYAGSTAGVSGNTIADLLARLPVALTQRSINTLSDVAILAIGRNDVGSVWDQSKKDNYLALINLLLAKYRTVLCRGILPEGSEVWASQNSDIGQIVTARVTPNVKFIDTATWSGIDTLDGVHPSEAGFAQIAQYAIPAYATALGITLP